MIPIPKNIKDKKSTIGFDPLRVDCPPTDNILTAEYCMIGDAPISTEVLEQEPFVGPAGSQLNRICSAVNIPRWKIYLTTACKAQLPKGKKIDLLWTEKGYRHPAWGELQKTLINELKEYQGKVIVTLGITATKLLLDSPRIDKISKFRGSPFKAEEFPHLAEPLAGKIIIPSYHPAFTLTHQNPLHFYTMLFDIQKAINLTDDPTLIEKHPQIITEPTYEAILQFSAWVKTKDIIGFDIEATPDFITCFSIAIETEDNIISMCVPVMNNSGNYWTTEQEVEIWTQLATILNDPDIGVVCQNGMFDIMFILRTMNIVTDNFYFDTMLAQHLVFTELPKGLDYLTSIYTFFPYYKDEGKQSHLSVIKDCPRYWNYNAKDSAYLFPIMKNLQKELNDFECTEAMQYQMDLHKPLMEMEFNGILTDQEGIEKYRKKLSRYIHALQHGLNKLSDRELNINSSKQLIAYFYGILMIKPYINRKTKSVTCNTVALHRIAKKGKAGSVEAKLIIKMRKYHKLLSTYFTVNVDADNRLRCSHSITGTVSGRIATKKTFFGTGTNLQNQPYAYKKYLKADDSHILCEVDLAKAEAHVVAYLTQDANMIEAFESGVDVHSFNASKIFNVPIEEVIDQHRSGKLEQRKTMRYMGKKVVHASNYNMGPGTFSDQLAVEEVFMSQSECKRLLLNYQDRFPGLKRWHKSIEDEVKQTRILYNLFNRPRRFLGIMNSALFRNAYSYKPQSTVAELLNRGTIKCSNDPRLGRDGYDIDFLTTVHDSDVFQFPISQAQNLFMILNIIKSHMDHTFTHLGKSFTIGLDATIGFRWKGRTYELSDFSQEECDKALEVIGV